MLNILCVDYIIYKFIIKRYDLNFNVSNIICIKGSWKIYFE